MGDMGDMYRDWKEIKKSSKAIKFDKNMQIIQDWLKEDEDRSLFVQLREHLVLFRFPDKPKVDFFPSTNKWRANNLTYYGDATSFLNWHEKYKP